jgi:hypothetical protein
MQWTTDISPSLPALERKMMMETGDSIRCRDRKLDKGKVDRHSAHFKLVGVF